MQKIEIGQAISLIQSDCKSMGGGGGGGGGGGRAVGGRAVGGGGSHHGTLPPSPRQPRYEWSQFDHGNLLVKNHYA